MTRPYRLEVARFYYAPTFASEEAARKSIKYYVNPGEAWKITRRVGSRHSRKTELVAEGVNEPGVSS